VGFVKPEEGGVKSFQTEPVWNVADAWIARRGSAAPPGTRDAGWMPSIRFAQQWLKFEKTAEHSTTPLE
jgi:hypothetical protein